MNLPKSVPSIVFVANLLNALLYITYSKLEEMPYHLIKQGFKFYGINSIQT